MKKCPRFYTVDITGNGIGKSYFFRPCRRFIITFPKREYQSFDTFTLLDVEHAIIGVERIERNRVVLRVGKIYTVFPFCFSFNQLTQSLIRVPVSTSST